MANGGSDTRKITISVEISRENLVRDVEITQDSSMIELVKELDLPVDGVLVLENGTPIPLDLTVKDINGKITVINVASGG